MPEAFIIAEWSCPKNAIKSGFHADFHHWFPGHYDLFRGEEKRSGSGGKGTGHSFFDKEGKGTVSRFLEGYFDHYKETAENGYISIPVGNHDLPRINIDRDDKDLEQITAFSLTFPGPPFIYYGDEIGMKHLPDVPNKEGAYSPRKGSRTPMQWNNEKNAGFSSGTSILQGNVFQSDLVSPYCLNRTSINVVHFSDRYMKKIHHGIHHFEHNGFRKNKLHLLR